MPIPITYTRLQNYMNMVVGKHGIQTIKVVVVVLLLSMLSFDVFVPHKCICLIIFGQVVSPNILKCQL